METKSIMALLVGLLLVLTVQSTVLAAEKVDDYSWIRGANYVPSYARNDVQMWMDYDAEIIDRELGYAARLKLNSVRVFLQYAVYKHNPERFLEQYENFLSLCNKHDIRPMMVLFDSCFGAFPDLENYRDKDWMANPGQNMIGPEYWPELEKYVQDIVGAYRSDKRILIWDIMNEPMMTSHSKTEKGREKILTFLDHFADVVKENNPTQPTTIGFCMMKSPELVPRYINDVTMIGWHNYDKDMNGMRADIHTKKELGLKHSKPIHINEIANRGRGQYFRDIMPVLREEKIGWYFWELMLGSTQFSRGDNPLCGVIYPDGSCRDAEEIAFILDVEVEEARKLFPERPPVEQVLKDGAMTYKGDWIRWSGKGPRDGYLFYASNAGSLAELTFTSRSELSLTHKVGPDCGIAEVWLDGKIIKEIDTYSPTVDWNKTTVLVSGLEKVGFPRTIQIRVTGRKAAASTHSYVQIVGLSQP